MGLTRYEEGGTASATHGLIVFGKDLNDVQKQNLIKNI